MALGYNGSNLQGATTEGSPGLTPYLRDFSHATKIFGSGSYDLAPKLKFLFHTFFDINQSAYTKNVNTGDNFGVLVKSVKLPAFTIKTIELNQYNRKRIVQTKINYDTVSITFHDDSLNTITKLWNAYYNYYYSDPSNLSGVFKGAVGSDVEPTAYEYGAINQNYNNRNIYDQNISGDVNWGYNVGPNKNKIPFFRNITIFGFSRHNFTAYTIINPIITKFDHDTYAYSESAGTMETRMDLSYESVVYNEGSMDGRTPDNIVKGFGSVDSYDKKISPITPENTNAYVPDGGTYRDADSGFVKPLS